MLQVARGRRRGTATELWRGARGPVRTSNLVVGETWTWLRRRAGHDAALRFLDVLERSQRVSVVVVDEAIDERAWHWLRRHDERTYSYVDATSFEIMRRERIAEHWHSTAISRLLDSSRPAHPPREICVNLESGADWTLLEVAAPGAPCRS